MPIRVAASRSARAAESSGHGPFLRKVDHPQARDSYRVVVNPLNRGRGSLRLAGRLRIESTCDVLLGVMSRERNAIGERKTNGFGPSRCEEVSQMRTVYLEDRLSFEA